MTKEQEKKAAYNRKYYEANREKELARQKEYYEANREKELARRKEYKQANREKISAQQKEYHEANREKILAQQKERYEANREKRLAQAKEYHEANREELLARQEEYNRAKGIKPIGYDYSNEPYILYLIYSPDSELYVGIAHRGELTEEQSFKRRHRSLQGVCDSAKPVEVWKQIRNDLSYKIFGTFSNRADARTVESSMIKDLRAAGITLLNVKD